MHPISSNCESSTSNILLQKFPSPEGPSFAMRVSERCQSRPMPVLDFWNWNDFRGADVGSSGIRGVPCQSSAWPPLPTSSSEKVPSPSTPKGRAQREPKAPHIRIVSSSSIPLPSKQVCFLRIKPSHTAVIPDL